MKWNKYPLRYATWIFIPLRCPPVCPSYPSNICGASLPEAFRLSTSTYPPVIPIAHVAAPDHCFQLFCRVIRTFSAATVKQLVLHSRPHAFAAGIVMTSPSAGLIAFSGVRSSMSGSPFFAACNHPYSVPYGTFSSSPARFTPIFSAGFTDCSL